MSTDSSHPSPDPKRTESKLSKQAKEATETDLWDLDFNDTVPVSRPDSSPGDSARLPSRRSADGSSVISKKPTDLHTKSPVVVGVPAPGMKSEEIPAVPATEAGVKTAGEEPQADSREWDETGVGKADAKTPKPLPAIPSIASLSKIEKIAISGLFAALALGATLTLIHFYNRVPTRPLVAEEIDFPVSGKIIQIKAASTYWREPVTTGENADVVRRGAQLIPVVKLSFSSKPGAIRVFFRNEDGLVVGDGITRTVKGDSEVAVAATAGFDDVGMHTAYRTGDGKRWVVQVFEGPDATASREKFRKVLETEISTVIR